MGARVLAATVAALLDAAAPAAGGEAPTAAIDPNTLSGHWKVVAVAVGGGVQALVADDPAYMGRTLGISGRLIAWDRPDSRATTDDRCEDPAMGRLTGPAAAVYRQRYAVQLARIGVCRSDPYVVECDRGLWGPQAIGGAILFPAPGGRVAMTWYDGAVLLLQRSRATHPIGWIVTIRPCP